MKLQILQRNTSSSNHSITLWFHLLYLAFCPQLNIIFMKLAAQMIKSLEVMNVRQTPSPGRSTLLMIMGNAGVEHLWLMKDGLFLLLTAMFREYNIRLLKLIKHVFNKLIFCVLWMCTLKLMTVKCNSCRISKSKAMEKSYTFHSVIKMSTLTNHLRLLSTDVICR